MSWKEFYQERKAVVLFVLFLIGISTLKWFYYSNTNHHHSFMETAHAPAAIGTQVLTNSDDEFTDDNFGPVKFDINGSDVMVFLHMQKTGGTTFGRHLIKNLDLVKQCDILEGRKRRNCLRPNSDTETWLFSRFSTGWICGLHSDWTELDECVDDKLDEYEKVVKTRRYFLVTMLRYPVNRFLSEYYHVNRGATWKRTLYSCNQHQNNIPRCFQGRNWRGVSLEDFIACPYNMGANRQTRMLADLRLINCYERWINRNLTQKEIVELENTMLRSAKENLKNMTYFGVMEEQVKMQALFEYAFPLKFRHKFFQYNATHITDVTVAEENITAIKKLNYLDMELYEYAKKLFDSRYRKMLLSESENV